MDNPNIYLLSIGINKYAYDPISNLSQTVKDVFNFQNTLLKLGYVSKTRCLTLCDHEATRENIIHTFRAHFSQLKDGDIAVLHYSGHGSQQPTHQVFIDTGYEPIGGKDESIVPYDSKLPGIFDIADKELRLLIAEIQKEKQTSFIGLFDCCHAGSMLKSVDLLNVKNTNLPGSARPLKTYLDGIYSKMYDASQSILIPMINYLSITACSPRELAYEGSSGGLFTNALIDVLNQSKVSQLSYSKLHYLTRLIVGKKSNNLQHPYLEYGDEANPFQSFLRQNTIIDQSSPRLSHNGQDWVANLGAIHGLELTNPRKNNIPIFDKKDLSSPIGYASIKNIHIEETTVSPRWSDPSQVNHNQLYIGLHAIKTPIHINIEEEALELKKDFEQIWASNIKHHFVLAEQAKYELNITKDTFSIYYRQYNNKNLLIGLAGTGPIALEWLFHQLELISKWENTLQLSTPKYSKIPLDSISFYFSYWDQAGKKITHLIGPTDKNSVAYPEITIPFDPNNGPVSYQVEVTHHYHCLHGLYFYLIHLDRKYQIQQKNENFLKPITNGIRTTLYNSQELRKGLGISDAKVLEANDTFIILASETPLTAPYGFHQAGFRGNMGKVITLQDISKTKEEMDNTDVLKANWMVKKLTVRLVRKSEV